MAYPSSPPSQPLPPWSPAPPPRTNYRPLIIGLAIGLPVLVLLITVALVAGGSGDDSDDPNAVAEGFVDAVNSGDAAAAEGYLCESWSVFVLDGSGPVSTVEEALAKDPEVSLTETVEDGLPGMSEPSFADLEGTLDSEPARGQLWLYQAEDPGPWCVQDFQLTAYAGD